MAMKTRMQELRRKLGLTQEAPAQKVDATRQTILFLEKGKYNPSLMLAYKIAHVLNSNIEDVFSFEDVSKSVGCWSPKEAFQSKKSTS